MTRRDRWPHCPCARWSGSEASRGAEAAYWASWADALPMISERNPAIAELVGHKKCTAKGV